MTAIIDYGVGNLFSLESSFAAIGESVVVTRDASVLRQADRLVLPGVGAFKDARQALRDSGLEETVLELAKDPSRRSMPPRSPEPTRTPAGSSAPCSP